MTTPAPTAIRAHIMPTNPASVPENGLLDVLPAAPWLVAELEASLVLEAELLDFVVVTVEL